MHELELVFGLLMAMAVLATVAGRLGVPYPILLVLGGIGLGFVPGLPAIELAPETVFLLFLPPLLFSAAYFTSWRDFRANARPIGLLAIGLVLATTVGVAAAAHAAIAGLGWPTAFLLGALVSPTDAVAMTAIAQRLGVPPRIVTILDGESIVNDATGLVAYRFAVAAVVTGAFSPWEAAARFGLVVAGGVAGGLAVGWALTRVLAFLDDPPIEILATLLAPVVAYLPAEEVGVSGVLAAATAGLYLGRRAPTLMPAATRLRAGAVWELVVFLINGFVFILIGLQLPTLLEGVGERPAAAVAWAAVVVCATVIGVRVVWVVTAAALPRWLTRWPRADAPAPAWPQTAVVAWGGLRGVISLAAALALPATTDAGDPFPERPLIVFLVFCVIVVTLVGQGLSLPFLIRRGGVAAGDDKTLREEVLARREAATAAMARLDQLGGADWLPDEQSVDRLRTRYGHRLDLLPEAADAVDAETGHVEAHGRLRRELLQAEREAAIRLRDRGKIGDDALRRLERDLDLEEERSDV